MVKHQLRQHFFYKLCSGQFELYMIRPLPNTYISRWPTGQAAIPHHQIANALSSNGQQIFYSVKYVFELPFLYSSITIKNYNLITCCGFGSNCLLVSIKYRKT